MISELTPVRVEPGSADAGFWARFHVLRRLRHDELWPEDPLRPDDVVETRMKRDDPFDSHEYFEISRDGLMVSSFHGETVTPANPEYATNKHLYWADAYVRPDQRRKGVGSLWLGVLARVMDEHGCTVAGFRADHREGHAFLEWLGAKPKLTEIESRLEMAGVDWPMVERWVHEGQQRSPQTRLEIFDGPLPEEMWPDFAAQRTALLNTMPFEDLELGDIIVTPDRIREWNEQFALVGMVFHTALTREPDGTISGMTDVEWAPYTRTHIQQQFTGVLPSARGRGIGKWLKAAMLLHVRELYPDAEWVATGNAHSNAPMLKINLDLGFKPYRTGVEYQITRDELGAKLKRL
ncbi:MAG TPA: GNAT family N-acetyltransferase [Candidatus Dormibacteraeota bacterium]|nr:GNAT family N-acetyltransferase [Candidatus Dormibacteraeota bacterium]